MTVQRARITVNINNTFRERPCEQNKERLTFEDAKEFCAAMNTSILIVRSNDEADFVYERLKTDTWLGYFTEFFDRAWEWADGGSVAASDPRIRLPAISKHMACIVTKMTLKLVNTGSYAFVCKYQTLTNGATFFVGLTAKTYSQVIRSYENDQLMNTELSTSIQNFEDSPQESFCIMLSGREVKSLPCNARLETTCKYRAVLVHQYYWIGSVKINGKWESIYGPRNPLIKYAEKHQAHIGSTRPCANTTNAGFVCNNQVILPGYTEFKAIERSCPKLWDYETEFAEEPKHVMTDDNHHYCVYTFKVTSTTFPNRGDHVSAEAAEHFCNSKLNGHLLFQYDEFLNFTEAFHFCRSMKETSLATFTSDTKMKQVMALLQPKQISSWLGIFLIHNKPQWINRNPSVSLDKIGFKMNKGCGAFTKKGDLISVDCNRKLPFICSYSGYIKVDTNNDVSTYACKVYFNQTEVQLHKPVNESLKWSDAERDCQILGGQLADFIDDAQYRIVTKKMSTTSKFWFGLKISRFGPYMTNGKKTTLFANYTIADSTSESLCVSGSVTNSKNNKEGSPRITECFRTLPFVCEYMQNMKNSFWVGARCLEKHWIGFKKELNYWKWGKGEFEKCENSVKSLYIVSENMKLAVRATLEQNAVICKYESTIAFQYS
uniref:C-type lectin domain-containing protein n=1 Tax=Syphacia muris TaxID=451379 RepID=A0A158R673_9BILA